MQVESLFEQCSDCRDSKQRFSFPLLRKKPRGPNWVLRKSLCSAQGSRGTLDSLEKPKKKWLVWLQPDCDIICSWIEVGGSRSCVILFQLTRNGACPLNENNVAFGDKTATKKGLTCSLFLDFFPGNSLCSQTSAQYTANDLDRDLSVYTGLYWLWNGPTLL